MAFFNADNPKNAHDIFVRTAMSDPRVAQEFLKIHLPKDLLLAIDLNHLVVQPRSYINDIRQETVVDVLYQTAIAKREAYVYLLIEHQSTPDPLMPFRILKYTCNVMDDCLKADTPKCLPLIFPLVVYHAPQPYPYSTDLKDLIDAPRNLIDRYCLQPFQLLDLGRIEDEMLKQHAWAGVMEMALKHIYARDILPHIRDMMGLLKQLEQSGGGNFVEIVLEYMLTRGELSNRKELFDLLSTELTPLTGGNVMTFAEQLKEEGREEGKLEVAEQLLSQGAESIYIAKITGLPLAKIEALQHTLV